MKEYERGRTKTNLKKQKINEVDSTFHSQYLVIMGILLDR